MNQVFCKVLLTVSAVELARIVLVPTRDRNRNHRIVLDVVITGK